MAYILEMRSDAIRYIHLAEGGSEALAKLLGIRLRPLGSAEARHSNAHEILAIPREHIKSLDTNEHSESAVKSARDADNEQTESLHTGREIVRGCLVDIIIEPVCIKKLAC